MIYPILLYKKEKNKLRKRSKYIYNKPNLIELINNMYDTMYYYNGIGLSAPQIGLNIRLFIIGLNKLKMIFINPKIIKYSEKKIINKEGCLSIPNLYVPIIRNKIIYVKYYNSFWEKKKIKLKNLLSVVFQHEYDHLKGKLILDYINYK
ncbi:MAG: peptide deformylase [Candidatus Shikimatogenerans bostrichidophilus]|nr:MAG: peptide deformylase [Candidatus Shikimatogenerans bostrichidophilus]